MLAPHRLLLSLGEPTQLPIARGADLDANNVQWLECGVNDGGSPRCLMGGDGDDDRVG